MIVESQFWDHVSHTADVAVILVPFLIWLIKWARRIENSTTFTKEVAVIHLPHIYGRLRDHDEALGYEPVQHPNISFVNGLYTSKTRHSR